MEPTTVQYYLYKRVSGLRSAWRSLVSVSVGSDPQIWGRTKERQGTEGQHPHAHAVCASALRPKGGVRRRAWVRYGITDCQCQCQLVKFFPILLTCMYE